MRWLSQPLQHRNTGSTIDVSFTNRLRGVLESHLENKIGDTIVKKWHTSVLSGLNDNTGLALFSGTKPLIWSHNWSLFQHSICRFNINQSSKKGVRLSSSVQRWNNPNLPNEVTESLHLFHLSISYKPREARFLTDKNSYNMQVNNMQTTSLMKSLYWLWEQIVTGVTATAQIQINSGC